MSKRGGRRGRGVDFEHRFGTSRWAEDLLLASLNAHGDLLAVRYGLSKVVEANALEYGQTDYKEPDLPVFRRADLSPDDAKAIQDKDFSEPASRAILEMEGRPIALLSRAIAAIEVEFSPYRAKEMAGRYWNPRTREHWDRRPLKHAKPPTAPNVWVKEEDLEKLLKWERRVKVPIVVAHLFDQEAFAVSLRDVAAFHRQLARSPNELNRIQVTTGRFKILQTYDRVDASGAREQKYCFVVTPAAATKVGDIDGVEVKSQVGLSSSKKYVSHVLFSGSRLNLSGEFLDLLGAVKRR